MIDFEYPYGATPLDTEEQDALLPKHISTMKNLNEWEYQNILSAEEWCAERAITNGRLLEQGFIKKIHYKMFDKTWKWAGHFRTTEKSIGIDPIYISVQLQSLLDDVKFQLENETYVIDEVVARFHHRLVYIHLFPNGNGRHARLVADLLLRANNAIEFSWGSNSLDKLSIVDIRRQYINALRSADKHNFQPLFEFVRR